MNCDAWVPMLVLAGEDRWDEIPRVDRDALSTHLSTCAACRQALDDQQLVSRLLACRDDAPVPAGFVERVRSSMDVGTAPAIASPRDIGTRWIDVVRWQVWSYRLAPLAAGLLIFALATAGNDADSQLDVGLPELTASWAFGDEDATRQPAFTVWGRDDVTSHELLDTILSVEPDAPLIEGGES